MAVYAEAKSWMAEEGGGIDLAAIPREFPQFGRSLGSLSRNRAKTVAREAEHSVCVLGCSTACSRCGGNCACRRTRAELLVVASDMSNLEWSVSHGPLRKRLPNIPTTTLDWPNDVSVIAPWFCNTVGTPVTQDPPERLCGPDVTDYVMQHLRQIFLDRQAGGQRAIKAVARTAPGSPIDLKKKQPKTTNCAKNCPVSITLCDRCVSDQIPGNVALGLAAGLRRAMRIGESSGGESGEDIQSYRIGDALYEIMVATDVGNPGGDAEGIAAAREALCELVKKAASKERKCEKLDDIGFHWYPCKPCKEKWP